MLTGQRETRVELVVELDVGPGRIVMTLDAIAAETALMHVVDAMTAGAEWRRVLITLIDMAGAAGQPGVGIDERKVGFGVMIEVLHRLLPAELAMTIAASLAKSAGMRVFGLVAGDAGRGRLVPGFVVPVTGAA